MRPGALLLLCAACVDFAGLSTDYCAKHPGSCDSDGGAAGGSSAGGSAAGGTTAGGSSGGGATAGGSSAGGASAGGSTAGGSTAGGSTAGGSTAGGAAMCGPYNFSGYSSAQRVNHDIAQGDEEGLAIAVDNGLLTSFVTSFNQSSGAGYTAMTSRDYEVTVGTSHQHLYAEDAGMTVRGLTRSTQNIALVYGSFGSPLHYESAFLDAGAGPTRPFFGVDTGLARFLRMPSLDGGPASAAAAVYTADGGLVVGYEFQSSFQGTPGWGIAIRQVDPGTFESFGTLVATGVCGGAGRMTLRTLEVRGEELLVSGQYYGPSCHFGSATLTGTTVYTAFVFYQSQGGTPWVGNVGGVTPVESEPIAARFSTSGVAFTYRTSNGATQVASYNLLGTAAGTGPDWASAGAEVRQMKTSSTGNEVWLGGTYTGTPTVCGYGLPLADGRDAFLFRCPNAMNASQRIVVRGCGDQVFNDFSVTASTVNPIGTSFGLSLLPDASWLSDGGDYFQADFPVP